MITNTVRTNVFATPDQTPVISSFQGEHRWLSNFWMSPLTIDGWNFASSEHAYQAAKSLDPTVWRMIQSYASPGEAKRAGMRIKLRPDWNEVRVQFMREILQAKFSNPDLKQRLLGTGTAELIEGNTWGDTFWGVCRGKGENNLGKLLMELRRDLA
jgi:ribA/ribD-fused uncharacterized protein